MEFVLKKKAFIPVSSHLSEYLESFGRSSALPPVYEDLHRYAELFPLFDKEGNDTLWKTVHYDTATRAELNERLTTIYARLKTGEARVVDHLRLERVDFCDFGNSRPFRIRIINNFNDNYDHFYVKVADSSRIYGLELEHILSPNRINYLVNENTIIEEHIAGVPGDVFIRNYFDHPDTNSVRVAKEFVKFSERCFCRLLGDMRSYNYVVDITPDFEEVQYRVRAIDFDQQSYEGRKEMYLTQFFAENRAVVERCTELLNYPTMQQYQNEERALIARRVKVAQRRLDAMFTSMQKDEISPPEKATQLAHELGEYHQSDAFKNCSTMSEVVMANLKVCIEKAGRR
ncbi:MAG: hypothetical protein KDN20_13080 [Verrucomicrobiae bacterium]|nr:hypothetical protein [Verrucomicrobiae bacterium]